MNELFKSYIDVSEELEELFEDAEKLDDNDMEEYIRFLDDNMHLYYNRQMNRLELDSDSYINDLTSYHYLPKNTSDIQELTNLKWSKIVEEIQEVADSKKEYAKQKSVEELAFLKELKNADFEECFL